MNKPIIVFCLLAGISGLGANYRPVTQFKPYELRAGETMTYEVKALGIVGLRAYLMITDKGTTPKVSKFFGNRVVYRAKMIIRTQGIFWDIYTMNDRLITYIDAKTMLPLVVYKNLHEGSFRNQVQIIFYHDKGYALYSDKHKKQRNAKCRILPQTLDLVSLIYYLRMVKPPTHQRFRMSYLSGMGLVETDVVIKPDPQLALPAYFLDREQHSHTKISQIGSHTVSAYISNDRYRVPTHILAENIQFAKRVKFKGYHLSQFARLGAFLSYYGIQK